MLAGAAAVYVVLDNSVTVASIAVGLKDTVTAWRSGDTSGAMQDGGGVAVDAVTAASPLPPFGGLRHL